MKLLKQMQTRIIQFYLEKYLKEMDIPLSPQSPIGINYGPISTGDFSTQDHSDYLLWFGANTKGEIVSTIIVEIGVPVVDFSTLPDAANTSSSKKDLPSVNDAAMLTGKITTTFEALPDQYALLKKEYAGMDISPETILLLDEPYTFVDADGEVVTIKGAIVTSSDAHGYEGKHVTILGKLAPICSARSSFRTHKVEGKNLQIGRPVFGNLQKSSHSRKKNLFFCNKLLYDVYKQSQDPKTILKRRRSS